MLVFLPKNTLFTLMDTSAATAAAPKKRVRITDPVEARVELINGMFPLPQASKEAMGDVRNAIEVAARAIARSVQANPHDKGRLIHTLDLLQQAKDTACVALILPHAEKDAE